MPALWPLICCLCALSELVAAKNPYKVLGLSNTASSAQIKSAYKQLAVKYHPDKNPTQAARGVFLDIQEAYELLHDEDRRREFDESRKFNWGSRGAGSWSSWSWSAASTTPVLDHQRIVTDVLRSETAWLLQVYSEGSLACRFAAAEWEKAAKELRGVAKLGRVQYEADPLLAVELAAAGSFGLLWPTMKDLPLIIGFPAGCRELSCGLPYSGPLQANSFVQFAADHICRLPQVARVTRATEDHFAVYAASYKVVALAFSSSPKASLGLRKLAVDFADRIAFGRITVRREDEEYWAEKYGVERLPALVFLRGPGSDPATFDSRSGAKLELQPLAEAHRWPLVPELRRPDAAELGCGWGLGVDHAAQAQACAVLVGRGRLLRPGRVKLAKLSKFLGMGAEGLEAVARAHRSSHLRLLWLDASKQKGFCLFHLRHLGEEAVRSGCGSERGWLGRMRFWEAWEAPRPQLVLYKPGAVRLSPWWSLPHVFSVFPHEVLRADHAEIASWLSGFLSKALPGVEEAQEVPPAMEDETVWWGMLWPDPHGVWGMAGTVGLIHSSALWVADRCGWKTAVAFATCVGAWLASASRRPTLSLLLLTVCLGVLTSAWTNDFGE